MPKTITSKEAQATKVKPIETKKNQEKPNRTPVAMNIGNSGTKIAKYVGVTPKAISVPSALLQVPTAKGFERVFQHGDDYFVAGVEADRDESAERLVYDLASLGDELKRIDFERYFKAAIVKLLDLTSTDIQYFRIALATSVEPEYFAAIKKEAQSLKKLVVNGDTYRVSIVVEEVYREGEGVIRTKKTLTGEPCDFSKAYLIDFGEGTIIVSRYDLSAMSSGFQSKKVRGSGLTSWNALGEGCAKISSTWSQWAAQYNGGMAPNASLLRRALERPVTKTGYSFTSDPTRNQGYNEALVKATAVRWKAVAQLPAVRTAFTERETSGFKVYACGGGTMLFYKQLVASGVEIVNQPRTADVLGLLSVLRANGGK